MIRHDTPTGADLRRWAMQCGARALAATCADERERLTRMREALLDLADNEDWLSGMSRGLNRGSRDAAARRAGPHDEIHARSRTG